MDDGFKKSDEVARKDEAGDVERGAEARTEKDGTEVVRTQTSEEPGLPFSKARTVALVATVAAAPFLSVSLLLAGDGRACVDVMADYGGAGFCYHSADHR